MTKPNKINCFIAFGILFLTLDTFFLLPDNIVVPLPGFFRLSDLFVIVILVSFTMGIRRVMMFVKTHSKICLIVFCSVFIFFMAAIMANLFFDQSFLTGLIQIRHSFFYLLFFTFIILIKNKEDLKYFIKLLSIFVFIIAVLSIIQKIFPSLSIFNYRSVGTLQYSEAKNIRLGDYRLFFPHISFAVLIYFVAFVGLFKPGRFFYKIPGIFVVVLIAFVVLKTGTRINIFTLLGVSIVALLTSKRKKLIIFGSALIFLVLSVQLLSMAVSKKGLDVIEENIISQLFMTLSDSKEGSISGRLFQHQMYMDNFLKSPIFGVGFLQFDKDRMKVYRKYGFYNNTDLGYSKILAEYGLLGLLWILWIYIYVFKKTKKICKDHFRPFNTTFPGIAAKGVQLFFFYILVSSITLPHFTEGVRILPIILAFVFLEVSHDAAFRKAKSDPILLNIKGHKESI